MFEDYDRGEKQQKAGMFRARLIILAVITVISLAVAGWFKWSKYSVHQKLVQRHEQTTAVFNNVYPNGRAPNIVYVITYTFKAGGKSYENTAETKITPRNPSGIVWYDPDNPDYNELQPIPGDEP